MDRLRCYACGATTSESDRYRCSCGEPLWLDTDPTGFEWPADTDRSMWRYSALLPAVTPTGLAASAGGTPLVRTDRLDGDVGATVSVKYEGSNPTGTFKDRGSAVGVAMAKTGTVATVSHGNMARSMAAHAASAGLDCLVFVPADVPQERLSLLARYDPTILRIEGEYGRLYEASLRLGRAHDIAVVNSDAPARVAGQKTTGLEILAAFAPSVPDAIVLPVSSGGHASGIWKGIEELFAAGVVTERPRLYFVQAAACAPIAAAWDRGETTVAPVDGGETVAYSIANADPPSGNRVLAAARRTSGGVLAVDDDAILDARRTLSERTGLFVESACATALAGARALGRQRAFEPDDEVVLVATGTGFTERDLATPSVSAPTVPLADLDDAVAARTD
ncbi:pyridoxal-phosphate dependent enzyme [Halomicroarcula sp. GCM10025709]|uniref:threonine synthase n=1 Tax=Haloarcula TaxID=2237 RepID=UPI0024C400E4|nr:pyridoxal-phosphate dependent enzyme [Halomicroarcula sp. YJ-61-S]